MKQKRTDPMFSTIDEWANAELVSLAVAIVAVLVVTVVHFTRMALRR